MREEDRTAVRNSEVPTEGIKESSENIAAYAGTWDNRPSRPEDGGEGIGAYSGQEEDNREGPLKGLKEDSLTAWDKTVPRNPYIPRTPQEFLESRPGKAGHRSAVIPLLVLAALVLVFGLATGGYGGVFCGLLLAVMGLISWITDRISQRNKKK